MGDFISKKVVINGGELHLVKDSKGELWVTLASLNRFLLLSSHQSANQITKMRILLAKSDNIAKIAAYGHTKLYCIKVNEIPSYLEQAEKVRDLKVGRENKFCILSNCHESILLKLFDAEIKKAKAQKPQVDRLHILEEQVTALTNKMSELLLLINENNVTILQNQSLEDIIQPLLSTREDPKRYSKTAWKMVYRKMQEDYGVDWSQFSLEDETVKTLPYYKKKIIEKHPELKEKFQSAVNGLLLA